MSRVPCLASAVVALAASAPGAPLPLSETFEVGGPAPDFVTVAEAIASVLVHDGDVLLGALEPALLLGILPLSDPLWFKPSAVAYLKALVAAGQDSPASASLLLPPGPSFAGLGVIFQAAFVGSSGVPTALTNPDELVLAW